MTRKKKAVPADDTLVAKTNIAIEGKHFDAGAPIEGVSEEELRRSVLARRVLTFAEFRKKSEPQPEPEPEMQPEPEPEPQPADTQGSTGEQPQA